jgi:hypothetical protein
MKLNFALPALALAAAALTAPASAAVPMYGTPGTQNPALGYTFTAPISGNLQIYYLGGLTVGYTHRVLASVNNGSYISGAPLSNSNLEGTLFDFGSVAAGDTFQFRLDIFAPSSVAGNQIFSDRTLNPNNLQLAWSTNWAGGAFTYQQAFFGPILNGSIPTGNYTYLAFEDILGRRSDGRNPQDFDYNDYRFAFSVNVIPEPATWAMMIAGFGLVGFAMRRRKSTIASVAA